MRENDQTIPPHVAGFINRRLRAFFWRYIIAFLLLAVPSAVAVNRAYDNTDQIQKQRYDSLVMSCKTQNERHDRTTTKLDRLDKNPKSRDIRRVLINELVPYTEDCEAVARKRVNGG